MKQQQPAQPARLERYALAVAVLVVLRLFAWELHLGLDVHAGAEERCTVCLVMERGGDAITPAAGKLPASAPAAMPCATQSLHVRGERAPCPLPRGPPSLPS
jgi:hypothetical protein